MAEADAVYGPDWPDFSKHWNAGTGQVFKPTDGHTWHGEIDLAGFRYQAAVSETVRRQGSVLLVRLYCLPPVAPLAVTP